MCNPIILNFTNLPLVRDITTRRTDNFMTHPDRILDFNVFLYITSGQMEVWEDGKEYIIKKDNVFFLKSGIHHWGEPKTLPGTSWYGIHFYDQSNPHIDNYEPFNDYYKFINTPFFSIEDYEHFVLLPKLFKVKFPNLVKNQLDKLKKIFDSNAPLKPLHLSLGTMELFLELYNETKQAELTSKSGIIVQKVIDFLNKKHYQATNSTEISDYLNMNYSYVANVFKKQTGISISKYFASLRINKAAQLLRETNLNVSEISNKLGYGSPEYLSKVFKQLMGLSPSEYLKYFYRNV